jgi:hypothetical protein
VVKRVAVVEFEMDYGSSDGGAIKGSEADRSDWMKTYNPLLSPLPASEPLIVTITSL